MQYLVPKIDENEYGDGEFSTGVFVSLNVCGSEIANARLENNLLSVQRIFSFLDT